MFTVYTDGSCLGNPGPGGVGIVVLENGNEIGRFSFGEKYTTNNRMELLATMSGIAYVKETFGYDSKILVKTDSRYVVDGMNQWRHGWKKNKWKNCKANLDVWKELDVLGDDCQYEWVKGHNKDYYNEIADDLALAAAKEAKETL